MSDDSFFELEVVTPKRVVFSGVAREVILPGVMGEMCILPGHSAMLSVLEPGLMTIKDSDDRSILWAVDSGFVQVQEDSVSVVAKFAWNAEDLAGDLQLEPLPSDLDKVHRVRRLNEAKIKVKGGAIRE